MLGLEGFFVWLIVFPGWISKYCLSHPTELKRTRIWSGETEEGTEHRAPPSSCVEEQVLQNWELIFGQKIDDLIKNGQISQRKTHTVCSCPVNIVLRGSLECPKSTLLLWHAGNPKLHSSWQILWQLLLFWKIWFSFPFFLSPVCPYGFVWLCFN